MTSAYQPENQVDRDDARAALTGLLIPNRILQVTLLLVVGCSLQVTFHVLGGTVGMILAFVVGIAFAGAVIHYGGALVMYWHWLRRMRRDPAWCPPLSRNP